MGQAEIGLLLLFGMFFFGYGVCYFFHAKPFKQHINWLNARLDENHQAYMAMADAVERLSP